MRASDVSLFKKGKKLRIPVTPMPTSDKPATPGQRLDWIDIAKGMCIALVVLGHSSDWYIRTFAPPFAELWDYLSLGLRPLRMPLFFLISGMLAASKIRRPLSALWDKTAGLYLLYCLWTAVYCLKLLMPIGRGGEDAPTLWQMIGAFILPTNLWYIWALPAYYLFAFVMERLTGRKSVYLLLPIAALAVAAPWLGEQAGDVLNTPLFVVYTYALAANLLWFYLGLKARDHIIALSRQRSTARSILGLGLGAAALVWNWITPNPLVSVIVVPFTLWGAIELLLRVPSGGWLGKPFTAIGQSTLQVYILHGFGLTAMTLVVSLVHLRDRFDFTTVPVMIAVPILICAAMIYACITASRLLDRLGLAALLKPIPAPQFKKAAVEKRA